MTTSIRTWPDSLFYLSGAGSANIAEQLRKVQVSAKLLRALSDASTVDTNSDKLQDRLLGLSLGDLTQRHKYRVLYDNLNDRFVVQRNSGTDASKVWVELLRIDASGNVTTTGTLSTDSLTTTAGGITLGGNLDVNDFYIRNVDKNVGQFRTDSLLVHQSSALRNLTISSTLAVTGAATLSGGATVTGTTQIPETTTLGTSNVDFFDVDCYMNAANQSITGASETDITSLTGLDLPNTSAVNTRKYLVHFTIGLTETSGATNVLTINLYNGANGTKADSSVYSVSRTLLASSLAESISGMFRFTPAASNRTKFGLAIISGGNCTVLGTAGARVSNLSIQEVP